MVSLAPFSGYFSSHILPWGKSQANKIQAVAELRFQTVVPIDMALLILSLNFQCLFYKFNRKDSEKFILKM